MSNAFLRSKNTTAFTSPWSITNVDRLKTETIQQSSSNPQIDISNHIIQQVSSNKVLGVIIDEQLKWKEHYDVQFKKISQSIALLKRAKQFISQDTLQNMFNALVLPHFTYCSNV